MNSSLVETTASVRLHYVTDDEPGIRRVRRRATFIYRTPDDRLVRDEKTLRRIRALVIPPAWSDVWICLSPHGHLQATGRDTAGRKQYRYHPRWRAIRDETKYARLATFGRLLPKIRARVRRDLRLPGIPRNKVLATIVRLMETTHLRVGNEEYLRANNSHGLTTLYDRHVQVRRNGLSFHFRGKGGKPCDVTLDDPRMAAIVRRCRDLPGQKLFQYVDEHGRRRTVGSADVNAYLREISGGDFTAKDFRTWAGTLWAARAVCESEPPQNRRACKRVGSAIVRVAAEHLGNTVAVCRKSYIHPLVLAAVDDRSLRRLLVPSGGVTKSPTAFEAMLLRYLKAGARRAA
jgi:DNA topoisomerase-1